MLLVAVSVAIIAASLALLPAQFTFVLAGTALTVVHRFSLRLQNGVAGLAAQLKIKKW